MLKLRVFNYFLSFYLLCLSSGAVAVESKGELSEVILPANWLVKPRVSVSVSIPEGFVCIQPQSVWDKSPMLEFIPKGESPYEWTEIITVQKILGKGIQAKELADRVKQGISRSTKVTGEWSLKSVDRQANGASFGLMYIDNKHFEIIGSVAYSGLIDCSSVQYTVRKDQDKDSTAAIKKISDFFQHNVKVIKTEEEPKGLYYR